MKPASTHYGRGSIVVRAGRITIVIDRQADPAAALEAARRLRELSRRIGRARAVARMTAKR